MTYQINDSNLIRLHALRARAGAAQRDGRTTMHAINAALEHVDLPVLPGVLGFPLAKIHAYASTSLLMLGSLRDRRTGVHHAQQAIDLYTARAERSFGDLLAARLDLATCHIHTDDLDGALEQVRTVTDSPHEHRTASITQRSQGILHLIETNQARPAHQMRNRINAFCAQPGPVPSQNTIEAR